jgi:hypothetical protein
MGEFDTLDFIIFLFFRLFTFLLREVGIFIRFFCIFCIQPGVSLVLLAFFCNCLVYFQRALELRFSFYFFHCLELTVLFCEYNLFASLHIQRKECFQFPFPILDAQIYGYGVLH